MFILKHEKVHPTLFQNTLTISVVSDRYQVL